MPQIYHKKRVFFVSLIFLSQDTFKVIVILFKTSYNLEFNFILKLNRKICSLKFMEEIQKTFGKPW